MIIHKPFSLTKTIGVEYNACIENSQEDWVILMDIDTCFLTPTQPLLIAKAIKEYGKRNVGMFVCKTNRVGYRQHLIHRQRSNDPDFTEHINIAKRLEAEEFSVSRAHHQCSGFFMCVNKKAWREIGGFKMDGLLGVDDDFSTRLDMAGYDILMINNLYIWHTYRLGTHAGDTSHLTK